MDIAQVITDRIITELEKGSAPWVKPWRDVKSRKHNGQPWNPASGTVYRGANWTFLTLVGSTFTSNAWITFKQANDLGGYVKKDQKGTPIIFWKPLAIKDKANPDQVTHVPMLKHYYVYNLDQCEDVTLPAPRETEPDYSAVDWNPCDKAESLIATLKLAGGLHHGGNEAFFRPSTDAIQMPEKGQFASRENYYATLLHEGIHATGHKSRLDREKGKRFGDHAYAYEELIAELGAAMLCAYCGLDGDLRHAAYIESWLKALKDDKKFIISAAGKAQAGMDYMIKGKQESAESSEELPLAA
jgi:antirestriction protein ArdC